MEARTLILHSNKFLTLCLLAGFSVLSITNGFSQDAPVEPSRSFNLDEGLKHFQSGQQPIVVPAITFVDVNSGRFGKLEIDLEDAQFLDTAVDKLHLIAKNLDVREGVLKSLDISVHGGHVHDFTFDQLDMTTESSMNFDSGALLNHRILQFTQPIQTQVTAIVSQDSLNRFLNSPKTLDRLCVRANGRAAAIASMVGINSGSLGLSVAKASLVIEKHNKIAVNFESNLGVGQMAIPINGEIEGTLSLQDGYLSIVDTHILTNGQELPSQVSAILVKKIDSVANSIQKSDDIRFNFTDLKVVAGKKIQLRGVAQVNRLRFGQAR
jgi:hypothetical protein